MAPLIAITAIVSVPHPVRGFYTGKRVEFAVSVMVEGVVGAGGVPIVVPVLATVPFAERYADLCDGLILSGGGDVAPEAWGESPRRPEWAGEPERDRFEFALLSAFLDRDLPVLGVCRGHQVLNVAFGGSLHQDLVDDGVVARPHKDPERHDRHRHRTTFTVGGYLHALYGAEHVVTNSVHHQGVRSLGDDLDVLALSEDGVIEGLRHRRYRYVVGVQWHPEWIDAAAVSEGVLPSDVLMADFLRHVRGGA